MNVHLARLALALCWLSACVGRTLVGEVRKDGGLGRVEIDLDASSTDLFAAAIDGSSEEDGVDAQKGIPQQGGASAIGGAPQQGGTGGRSFSTLVLQPGPGVGEDVSVLLLGANPYPLRSDVAQLSVQTTTFDSVPSVRRSLIRFAMPRMFGAQDIIKAQLLLWHDPDLVSHTIGTRWRLGRTASDWEQQSLSWLNQPPIASDSIEPPAPASSSTDYVVDVTDFVRADLAERKEPNFALRLVDEETLGQRITFCSSEHTDAPCRPTLYIELTVSSL